jgi:hypothetical protein
MGAYVTVHALADAQAIPGGLCAGRRSAIKLRLARNSDAAWSFGSGFGRVRQEVKPLRRQDAADDGMADRSDVTAPKQRLLLRCLPGPSEGGPVMPVRHD